MCVCVCAKRKRGRLFLSLCVRACFSIFESRARFVVSLTSLPSRKKNLKRREIQNFEISHHHTKTAKKEQQKKELFHNSIIATHTKLNHYIKLLKINYASSSTTFFYYYRFIISRCYRQFSLGEEGVVQLLGDEFEPRLVDLRETSLPIGG